MNNGCTFPSTASRNSLTPQQFARVTEDQMIVFEQGEVESTVWPGEFISTMSYPGGVQFSCTAGVTDVYCGGNRCVP